MALILLLDALFIYLLLLDVNLQVKLKMEKMVMLQ